MNPTPESLQEQIDQLESSVPADGDYDRVNKEINALQDQLIRLQWGTGAQKRPEEQSIARSRTFKVS